MEPTAHSLVNNQEPISAVSADSLQGREEGLAIPAKSAAGGHLRPHTAANASQGWIAMPTNLLRMLRVLGGDLSVCVAGVGGDFTGQSSELAEVSMLLKASANQSVLGNRWQRTGIATVVLSDTHESLVAFSQN